LLPILLLVLPWVVRNYVVFDELMMATNVGYVVWGVHNPDTFADLNLMGKWVPPDAGFRNAGQRYSGPLDPAYRYLPEPEWNRQLFRMGLDSIRQNIRSLPRMELYKLHRLIFAGGAVRNLFRFPLLYSFVFGLIILLLASKSERPLLILYMLIAFSVLTTLVFYTNPRLRMSVDPAFIIILSYGLIEQIRMIDLSRKNRGWLPM
jgi:hypothetical protein